ncbi:MAG: hypothetical protein FJ098_02625, partial [Deltaproteobacteria bacterium]|nr:hypothetical protein [Deltaproteobacteria bacterium]
HREHEGIRPFLENGARLADHHELADTGPGWSYVTFYPLGTRSDQVLFDLSRLAATAEDLGFFLPDEVISQHNKIVVTAISGEPRSSLQLYALAKLLLAYGARHANPRSNPRLGWYGKFGGIYSRPEKGRVLVIYAENDDCLLEIEAALQDLVPECRVPGVAFELRLGNGLSDLPRMLKGYHDPEYRDAGVLHFKITDPHRFSTLVDQARVDYGNYLFEKPA